MPAAQFVKPCLGQFDLKAQHGGRERFAVVVQAQAARDAAAERAVADEVPRLEVGDLVAQHLAGDRSLVESLEAFGGQLRLQQRVELRFVGKDRDVGDIAFVARAGMRQMLQLDFHRDLFSFRSSRYGLAPPRAAPAPTTDLSPRASADDSPISSCRRSWGGTRLPVCAIPDTAMPSTSRPTLAASARVLVRAATRTATPQGSTASSPLAPPSIAFRPRKWIRSSSACSCTILKRSWRIFLAHRARRSAPQPPQNNKTSPIQ